MQSASEVLAKAAELISERGWCQEAFIEDDGSLCTMGAIQVALGFTEEDVVYPKFIPEDGSAPITQRTLVPPLDVVSNHDEYANLAKECQAHVLRVIRRSAPYIFSVPAWNDLNTTTKEDAVLALKEASLNA